MNFFFFDNVFLACLSAQNTIYALFTIQFVVETHNSPIVEDVWPSAIMIVSSLLNMSVVPGG